MNNDSIDIPKLNAATLFSADPAGVRPVGGGNSTAEVYRAESANGPIILKIIRVPDEMSESDLEAAVSKGIEGLEFEETLANESTETVAFNQPLRSRNGLLAEIVRNDGKPYVAFAYRCAPGEDIRHRDRGYSIPVERVEIGGPIFTLLGVAMGRLHRVSSEYPDWWAADDADRRGNPFFGQSNREGAGRMDSYYGRTAWLEESLSAAPELVDHWNEIKPITQLMTAERHEYGHLHFDLSLSNSMYDGTTLTVIDFSGTYGHFAVDIGAPFHNLLELDGSSDLYPEYWLRFLEGYRQEFTFSPDWIPWISAELDVRRLAHYLINAVRREEGVDSYDYPEMEKNRADMLAGKPSVPFDFAL